MKLKDKPVRVRVEEDENDQIFYYKIGDIYKIVRLTKDYDAISASIFASNYIDRWCLEREAIG